MESEFDFFSVWKSLENRQKVFFESSATASVMWPSHFGNKSPKSFKSSNKVEVNVVKRGVLNEKKSQRAALTASKRPIKRIKRGCCHRGYKGNVWKKKISISREVKPEIKV